MSLFAPFVSFEKITLETANDLLVKWGHKMGPLPTQGFRSHVLCHALLHEGMPVALTTTSALIGERVQHNPHLTRSNTVELSRLCASRPNLCRVALRLWREFVFESLPEQFAVSYQDADIHNGNTYRFDGWARMDKIAHSGTDRRSGRAGRDKVVWVYPPIKNTNLLEK